MKQTLRTNFVPYNDADFFGFASSVMFSMQNNAHFPDPVPPLDTISKLVNQFSDSLSDAATKNTMDIAVKNKLRKQLEHQLGRLALYVMYIADENEAILVSSGYHLTKRRAGNKVEAPQQPTLISGISSGEIIGMIKAVKGAKYYLFQITSGDLTEDSVWEMHSCSRRKYTFSNLTPGKRYWVRVVVLGTGKQKAYSQPASLWAQ